MMTYVSGYRALLASAAERGLLFGSAANPLGMHEPAAAVSAYLEDPATVAGFDPEVFTAAELAVAIVAGARAVAHDMAVLEKAAAQLARQHGVTIRQLAAAAGISERAASSRYSRIQEATDA